VVKELVMDKPEKIVDVVQDETEHDKDLHNAPGTFALVLILLASFAVYYFANWKALADVWHVR
jgi:cytochrome c oxidase subunit I